VKRQKEVREIEERKKDKVSTERERVEGAGNRQGMATKGRLLVSCLKMELVKAKCEK
jgi:hypothetical protein